MKKSVRKKNLYKTMFKVGCIGFGGGSALVPVIEKEVVQEQKIISKAEYDKDVIIASITPGALPMEIAAGIGKRCFGTGGMLTSAVLMTLPGVVLTLLLLSVLSGVNQVVLQQISFLSIGVTAFIACMLTNYIMNTTQCAQKGSKKRWIGSLVIILGVFVLTMGKNLYWMLGIDRQPVFGLSTIQVLVMAFFILFYTKCSFHKTNVIVSGIFCLLYLACVGKRQWITSEVFAFLVKAGMFCLAAYGLYQSMAKEQKYSKVPVSILRREEKIWCLFAVICAVPALVLQWDNIAFFLKSILSSLLSFGGGDAYLAVADGLFVDSDMIDSELFYGKLVPVVNLLPGSILSKTLTGIGYYIGYGMEGKYWQGIFVALMGFAASVAASGSVFCLGYYLFQKFKNLDVFHLLSRLIKPIISGLLLTVMLSLVRQNVRIGQSTGIGEGYSLLIMGICYGWNMILLFRKKSNGMMIAGSVIGSWIFCQMV